MHCFHSVILKQTLKFPLVVHPQAMVSTMNHQMTHPNSSKYNKRQENPFR